MANQCLLQALTMTQIELLAYWKEVLVPVITGLSLPYNSIKTLLNRTLHLAAYFRHTPGNLAGKASP